MLVKLHLRHNQLLSIIYLGVEAAADTVAVAKDATVEIVFVGQVGGSCGNS